jgi:hypothetical protein
MDVLDGWPDRWTGAGAYGAVDGKVSGASDGKVSGVDPAGRAKVTGEAAREVAGAGVPLTSIVREMCKAPTFSFSFVTGGKIHGNKNKCLKNCFKRFERKFSGQRYD